MHSLRISLNGPPLKKKSSLNQNYIDETGKLPPWGICPPYLTYDLGACSEKKKGATTDYGKKGFVVPTKSFGKTGITKIFCYNNKIFSSINKTFGCGSKIFG